MKDRTNIIWNWLIDTGVATEEEIQLVTTINGYNEDTVNAILYARTGYRSIEQVEECEG